MQHLPNLIDSNTKNHHHHHHLINLFSATHRNHTKATAAAAAATLSEYPILNLSTNHKIYDSLLNNWLTSSTSTSSSNLSNNINIFNNTETAAALAALKFNFHGDLGVSHVNKRDRNANSDTSFTNSYTNFLNSIQSIKFNHISMLNGAHNNTNMSQINDKEEVMFKSNF